jgi:hypothetical protein
MARMVPRRANLVSHTTDQDRTVSPNAAPARLAPMPPDAAEGRVVAVIGHEGKTSMIDGKLGLPSGQQKTTMDGEHDHE